MFNEKLDQLMRLTGVSNSALGRAAHVDASTVSRLRSGRRRLPKRQNFLPLMCDYLAKNITSQYKLRSVADAMCVPALAPGESAVTAETIHTWLLEDVRADIGIGGQRSAVSSSDAVCETREGCFYFGSEGKRSAVMRFLKVVISASKPRVLLLYSDEPMDWLYENAVFAEAWGALMREAIRQGNKIRVIHNMARSLEELLQALDKWLGIYMTGAVEPFICPRLRDGISRRTIFAASELAAVSASSAGTQTRDTMTVYTDDARAISAVTTEYNEYLKLCSPMLRVYLKRDTAALNGQLSRLLTGSGDVFILSGCPDFIRLPGFNGSSNTAGAYAPLETDTDASCVNEPGSVYAIFPLLASADFRAGSTVHGIYLGSQSEYTKSGYAALLTELISVMSYRSDIHVILSGDPLFSSKASLIYRRQTGAVITKNDCSAAFSVREAGLLAVFGEYLRKYEDIVKTPEHRKNVISHITDAIRSMTE